MAIGSNGRDVCPTVRRIGDVPMINSTRTETVEYIAQRDGGPSIRGDENRAMAHARIYRGDSLADAQAALYAYMIREAEWLMTGPYRSARSVARAAEILEAAESVEFLAPSPGKQWAQASVTPCNLVFQIVRIVR